MIPESWKISSPISRLVSWGASSIPNFPEGASLTGPEQKGMCAEPGTKGYHATPHGVNRNCMTICYNHTIPSGLQKQHAAPYGA